ncbi:MAG: hypothetical protein Tsb0014_15990 [Pleurocapsa sp.]
MKFEENSNKKLKQELLEIAKLELQHDVEIDEELTEDEAEAVSGGLNKVHISSLHADQWDTVVDPPPDQFSSGFLGLITKN